MFFLIAWNVDHGRKDEIIACTALVCLLTDEFAEVITIEIKNTSVQSV